MFRIGDKVLFKKDTQRGIIINFILSDKVIVETKDGFKLSVSVKDLVKVEEGTDKASSYGVEFNMKDKIIKSKKVTKQERRKLVLKVDLHIESLTDNYDYMSNFEIVQIQLNKCHKYIEKALSSDCQKLIIVHGIGTGLLRDEVHKLLDNYKLRYYLSKDAGSTEVML